MALNGCSNGLLVTAVVALLLLPVQYYVPDFYTSTEDPLATPDQPESSFTGFAWFNLAALKPPVDLLITITLVILGLFTYLCEWVQRKLMERRIVKLNEFLGASLERLRAWDEQQEQQEATLKMVQNATSEYNLLLYLLLHQHRGLATQNESPTTCYGDKALDDDLNFLRTLQIDS